MKRPQKKKLILDFATHKQDTGSPHVQIAIFTERIKDLSDHLLKHKSDKHSRHGLVKLVGKRRRLLNHLKEKSKEQYEKLVDKLGLRK